MHKCKSTSHNQFVLIKQIGNEWMAYMLTVAAAITENSTNVTENSTKVTEN